MEALIRQAKWLRFSSKEEPEQGKKPRQKTASFKGAQKKWFSRQMSLIESVEEAEFATAIAAAAFAITNSMETDNSTRRKMKEPESLPAMVKLGESSRSFADKAEDSENHEIFYDAISGPDEMVIPVKTIHPLPSLKKTPKKRLNFADELPEDPESLKKTRSFAREASEDAEPRMRMPTVNTAPLPIPTPAIPPLYIEKTPTRVKARGEEETDADGWERQEIDKIKERYQKLNATILEWEEKKKSKAKRKLETTESELEKRRAKSKQKYQSKMEEIQEIADGARAKAKDKHTSEELHATIQEWEDEKKKSALRKMRMTEVEIENKRVRSTQRHQIEMEQIKEIADGAKAQAKEKLRNEQLKAKEKAARYRQTGEPPLPPMCQCL